MSGHNAEGPKRNAADMTAYVQKSTVAKQVREIVKLHHFKVDEMGSRMEELEQSINDFREEIGVESSPAPSDAAREKSPMHEVKPEIEKP